MRLPATARAERGSLCWRRTHCQRFVHLGTTLLRDRSRNGDSDPRLRRKSTRQEKEHVSPTSRAWCAILRGTPCGGALA